MTMHTHLPALSPQQQEQAVDRIQQLISRGISSGEAIRQVAQEIRTEHVGEMVHVCFEDDEL